MMTDKQARAALFELIDTSWLALRGADRVAWLHRICTNNIKTLGAGQGLHACVLTATGKLISQFRVYALDDALWLEIPSSDVETVLALFERYIILEDVLVEDLRDALNVLSVQGPGCEDVMGRVPLMPPPRDALGHVGVTWSDARVRCIRHDRSGMGGVDLVVPSAKASSLREALEAAGARPTPPDALNALRIQAGIPWPGFELTNESRPDDVGLGHTICYTKGCFPGQEVMAKLQTRGNPSRKLWRVRLPRDAQPEIGAGVLREGKTIGKLTSFARMPDGDQAIGLAVLTWGAVEPGTKVEIEGHAGEVLKTA